MSGWDYVFPVSVTLHGLELDEQTIAEEIVETIQTALVTRFQNPSEDSGTRIKFHFGESTARFFDTEESE